MFKPSSGAKHKENAGLLGFSHEQLGFNIGLTMEIVFNCPNFRWKIGIYHDSNIKHLGLEFGGLHFWKATIEPQFHGVCKVLVRWDMAILGLHFST